MKTALIIGGTGLIGKELTKKLLDSTAYDKVISLLRKPLTIRNPKLEQYVYDFENPRVEIVKADHIYCCLGTTIKKAGSRETFHKIDHDYALNTARIALSNHAELFSIVSAIGANADSRIFYNQTKGKLENELIKLGYPHLHIYRPSILLGDRREKRFGEDMAKFFTNLFSFLIPDKYKGIQASVIASMMLKNALEKEKGTLYIENNELIKYAKEL